MDNDYNHMVADWAVPGTVLHVNRAITADMPSDLYFVGFDNFEAEGVTLTYDEDMYSMMFVMPDHDVSIAHVMAQRMNPVIDLSDARTVEVARGVAEGLMYCYMPDEHDLEDPLDIDLNGDGSDDIHVTCGSYVMPEEGDEEPEPVLTPSYVERLAGADALTGPVTVVFDDYGYPNDMPYIGCVIRTAPVFGPATFTLPAALTTIEESAFEGMAAMTVVDASGVTSIGANAFKGCTGLTQIRLPANCAIDATAFDGCGTVVVFAPAGGATAAYCQSNDNPCVFVEEAAD